MKRSELRYLIQEIIKKKLKEKKYSRYADSYISSPTDEKVVLYINVRIEAKNVEDADKQRNELMETLKTKHHIHVPKRD